MIIGYLYHTTIYLVRGSFGISLMAEQLPSCPSVCSCLDRFSWVFNTMCQKCITVMSEAGKSAFVTGGASGIGKAVVQMLSEKG